MDCLEELTLITKCKNGDRQGQRLLYEEFASPMIYLCLRYVKNEQDAHHVLNEGFLKVFKNLKSFEYRKEGLLRAWIKKIMVNEALMFLRKNKQLSFVDIEQMQIHPAVESACLTDEQDILEVVRNLPTGYRTVFNLFVMEGYDHKEISVLLNISESTSRSQLTHARNRLKQILSKSGFTYG